MKMETLIALLLLNSIVFATDARFSWDAPKPEHAVTFTKVFYRATSDPTKELVAEVAQPSNELIVKDLVPGETYTATAIFGNADDVSEKSAEITFRIPKVITPPSLKVEVTVEVKVSVTSPFTP